ncbi:MAG: hypothetical protein H8E40_04345 [Chloroflexi bacterium]|nr:hypothetical protein [Chloroflexota bacterium]
MLEIEGLSKETVYNVMTELLYSFNFMVYLFEDWVKTKHPEEFESEEFRRLYGEFGSYQAKRLCKALDISGGGIDVLIKLMKHSHWTVFENIEVEKLTEKSFRMRGIQCSAQKAAKRWGMEYNDCRIRSSRFCNGLFRVANQNVKVRQVFAPPEIGPEGTPENVSCEWLISIEEK